MRVCIYYQNMIYTNLTLRRRGRRRSSRAANIVIECKLVCARAYVFCKYTQVYIEEKKTSEIRERDFCILRARSSNDSSFMAGWSRLFGLSFNAGIFGRGLYAAFFSSSSTLAFYCPVRVVFFFFIFTSLGLYSIKVAFRFLQLPTEIYRALSNVRLRLSTDV